MIPLVAELLANGLGLLGNAVMAKGKEVVEEKLGVKLPETAATQEQILALKQLEFQHEEWLVSQSLEEKKLELEETKAYLGDAADARGMQETALKTDDIFARRFVYYFATAVLLFSVVYISAITFCKIPEENIRFADTILGFLLGTLLTTIINFFFGTSKSSQSKDTVISDVVKHITKGG